MSDNNNLSLNNKESAKSAKKVTIIGGIVNVTLGLLKMVTGFFANSHALIIDGVHSLSDAITDLFVIFISHFSRHDPDDDHPYGHERLETIGTVVLGTFLTAVAGALAYNSIERFFLLDELEIPSWPAALIAFISIVVKEIMFRYTFSVGKRINSKMIMANAWHGRTDALSSIVVLIGVLFAMLGYTWPDIVAGLVIAILIGKVGFDFLWDSLKELIDTNLDIELNKQIKESILEMDGIDGIHTLRSRRMGPKLLLDLHIQVPSKITVSEGHYIAVMVIDKVVKNYPSVVDVLVHVDVEDDQVSSYSICEPTDNPSKAQMNDLVKNLVVKSGHNQDVVSDIRLHYLAGKVDLEIYINKSYFSQLDMEREVEKFKYELIKGLKKNSWCREILFFSSF